MKIIKYSLFILIAFFFTGCDGNYGHNQYNGGSNTSQNQHEYYSEQLANIRRNKYNKSKLLNNDEMKLYWALINELKHLKLMVCPQTNLGSLLSHRESSEHRLINCKRVDFCIIDNYSNPIAVIEYNGSGHYQNHSSIRDDIKRIACNSADLKFIEISFHDKSDFNKAVREKILPLIRKV